MSTPLNLSLLKLKNIDYSTKAYKQNLRVFPHSIDENTIKNTSELTIDQIDKQLNIYIKLKFKYLFKEDEANTYINEVIHSLLFFRQERLNNG